VYFDVRAAKLLQPGNHIVVDGCPGLRLVASTKGKAWTYRYQRPGASGMRQIKIGQWPAMAPITAAARWQELKEQRDSGVDLSQQKRQTRQQALAEVYTVADIVADYITGHLQANRQPAGASAVAARLTKAIAPISRQSAAGITRRQAFDLIAGLSGAPVAAKSVRNELACAWDLALDAGKLAEDAPNWWRQIMAGKLRSKGALRDGEHKGTSKRVLSEPELRTLLTVDFALLARTVQDVLTLYLWTGCRGGEVVQMHASQVTHEADGWWWTMPKAITKNVKREKAGDVRVPLVGRALDVVMRRVDAHTGYAFEAATVAGYTSQASVMSAVHFRQPYSNTRPDVVRTRLTVTHWSPHDLRRTVRTQLANLGCPTDVAESILGHVQPGIQGVYNRHHYDAERRHWLQLWSDRLEAIQAS